MFLGSLHRAFAGTVAFLVFAAVVLSGQFPMLTALFGPLVESVIGSRADALAAGWMTWRSDPESTADATCKGLWVQGARNDMALRCYATTNISRFCDPQERAHFGWLVARYVQDERAFNQTLLAIIPVLALAQAKQMQGAAGSRALPPQLQDLRDSGFEKAFRLPVLRDVEVTALIKNLADKGYVHRNDLAWHLPAHLESGFTQNDPVNLPANCQTG